LESAVPRSHVGCVVVRFPNSNRALIRSDLNHTFLFFANALKQAVTILRSCIANWWPAAIPHRIGQCISSSFACAPLGKKNVAKGCNLSPTPLSAPQATFLFLCRFEDLEAHEQQTLITLRHLHPEIDLAYDLVQQFAQIVRTRTGEQLDCWLSTVRASKICELQGIVAGVQRDKAAVAAGLTLVQNNGVVEGHVNKLKLIKRMGYGRAGFPEARAGACCMRCREGKEPARFGMIEYLYESSITSPLFEREDMKCLPLGASAV
jgi:hypothetical protein